MTCTLIRQTPFSHQSLFKVSLKSGSLTQVSLYCTNTQADIGPPCPCMRKCPFSHIENYMSRATAFPTRLHLRPAKTQISLRIRAVWSEFPLSAWPRFGSLATHRVSCEDSDQTARMRRLIWFFAGRTCNLEGNAVPRLICNIVEGCNLYVTAKGCMLDVTQTLICFTNFSSTECYLFIPSIV